MSFLEVFFIALGLSADAFAVALCIGTAGYAYERRTRLRVAWHFGFFQFLMPIIGWYLGFMIEKWVETFDHWIAFFLLAIVGVRMIHASLYPEEVRVRKNPTRGWVLLWFSIATSIDAFAVGFSLALLAISVWQPSIIIGAITAVTSYIGVRMGTKLHRLYGRIAEGVGGIVLIGIGLRILLSHLHVV
ncbi:MAG: manganese efflux pump MntP family protein [Bacteroidetes bacterium]|nr:manganese efflux pump MntP family protein [Bacteroidota bacterium]